MSRLLHHSIIDSAERYPDKDAFRCKGEVLRYGELHRRSDMLASVLLDRGVKPGDRVGIFMNKRVELPVALYGILKSGAAYVPIDPAAPIDRVRFIIDDCGIEILVTDGNKKRQIAAMEKLDWNSKPKLFIGIDEPLAGKIPTLSWSNVFREDRPPASVSVGEDSLAYILYTSGSTGEPKGLMHTHGSGLAYARYSSETYGLGCSDVTGNHAPLHFDISTFDFLTAPYCSSCSVLIPEETLMFPISVSELIERERLTYWYSVPLALVQMLIHGDIENRDLSSLKWVLFAGEPISPKHLRALMDRIPTARFSNIYGPAEVNQCTHYNVPADFSGSSDSVPIGRPWNGAKGKIVGEGDREVTPGEPGELLISSPTMMSGYWNREDLNANAFHEARSSSGRLERYYRTGDIVKCDDQNELLFLGRKDRQIKIRGYRLELDEVEQVLNAHDGVRESAVVAVADVEGVHSIHAFVYTLDEVDVAGSELHRYLSSKLPSYGVPDSIKLVSSFPRTSTGKIDRKTLESEAESRRQEPG